MPLCLTAFSVLLLCAIHYINVQLELHPGVFISLRRHSCHIKLRLNKSICFYLVHLFYVSLILRPSQDSKGWRWSFTPLQSHYLTSLNDVRELWLDVNPGPQFLLCERNPNISPLSEVVSLPSPQTLVVGKLPSPPHITENRAGLVLWTTHQRIYLLQRAGSSMSNWEKLRPASVQFKLVETTNSSSAWEMSEGQKLQPQIMLTLPFFCTHVLYNAMNSGYVCAGWACYFSFSQCQLHFPIPQTTPFP